MIKDIILKSWPGGVRAAEETSWPPGAISQLAVDEVSLESSPRAWNNIMAIIGTRAVPRKREGCLTMNGTPVTGSPAIIGQGCYRYRNAAGTLTQFHLLASDNGRLDWMNESGVVTTVDAAAFTPGFHPPSFATLNNHCFIVNGLNPCKMAQGVRQNFGIVRPVVGVAKANAGLAGNFNGTYELAFTFYNNVSGHESSRSDSTPIMTATFTNIDVIDIPTTTDTQVDTVFIYVRNTETQAQFYRAGSVARGTTTATLTVATTDVDLIIPGPNTTENDPPLSTVKYAIAHKGRLLLADDGKLYWSKLGKPEAIDPTAWDYVNENDGQKITGLVSLPGGVALILKQDGYYVLEGDTPGVWAISRVGPAVGCIAPQSVVLGADAVYWWGEQGPVRVGFDSLGAPALIGNNLISSPISRRNMNYAERTRIVGTFHLSGQRVIWAIPEYAQVRNTRMLVWSSRLSNWESDKWDPIDAASLTTMEDTNSESFVMIGGYAGQVFKLGLGYSDGVVSGLTSFTFTASATTYSSLTTGAGVTHFDTAGGKLIERKLTVLNADDEIMTTGIRPRILTTSDHTITFTPAISGLTSGQVYTVIIGGPDWQFDTSWVDGDAPFEKKRLLFTYIMAMLYGQTMEVDVLSNRRGLTLEQERLASIVGAGTLWNTTGQLWDNGTGTYNTAVWNNMEVTYDRIRGARHGTSFALRCRNAYPNQSMILLKVGLQLEMGDDKLG